jgi:hypothetical protein
MFHQVVDAPTFEQANRDAISEQCLIVINCAHELEHKVFNATGDLWAYFPNDGSC